MLFAFANAVRCFRLPLSLLPDADAIAFACHFLYFSSPFSMLMLMPLLIFILPSPDFAAAHA